MSHNRKEIDSEEDSNITRDTNLGGNVYNQNEDATNGVEGNSMVMEGDEKVVNGREGIRTDNGVDATNNTGNGEESSNTVKCKSPMVTKSMLNCDVNDDIKGVGYVDTVNTHTPDIKSVSYAEKLNSNKECIINKLYQIPTMLNKDGHEHVIFDDEIINEGS